MTSTGDFIMAASSSTEPTGWWQQASDWWYGTNELAQHQCFLPDHQEEKDRIHLSNARVSHKKPLESTGHYLAGIARRQLQGWIAKDLKRNVDSHLDLNYLKDHSVASVLAHIAEHKLADKAFALVLPPHLVLTAKMVEAVFDVCKGIKVIKATMVDKDAVQVLSTQKVTHLDLSTAKEITDVDLLGIVEGNPQLESLDISHCDLLTDEGVLGLSYLPNLRELRANGCHGVTACGWTQLPSSIRHLELVDCDINDSLAIGIAEMEELQYLDLHCCAQFEGAAPKVSLSAEVIATLVEKLPKLQVLSLAGLYRETGDTLCGIAELKFLRVLDLANNRISEELLSDLSTMPHLEYLSLRDAIGIKEGDFAALEGSQLRGVDVTLDKPLSVGDLSSLPRSLEELHGNFDLKGCIPVLGEFTDLRILTCNLEPSAEEMKKHWSGFPELRVFAGPIAGDTALAALAKNSPKLEELVIDSPTDLTDKGVEALAESAEALKKVHILNAPGLTEASILALAKKPHPIESLDLGATPIHKPGRVALTSFTMKGEK